MQPADSDSLPQGAGCVNGRAPGLFVSGAEADKMDEETAAAHRSARERASYVLQLPTFPTTIDALARWLAEDLPDPPRRLNLVHPDGRRFWSVRANRDIERLDRYACVRFQFWQVLRDGKGVVLPFENWAYGVFFDLADVGSHTSVRMRVRPWAVPYAALLLEMIRYAWPQLESLDDAAQHLCDLAAKPSPVVETSAERPKKTAYSENVRAYEQVQAGRSRQEVYLEWLMERQVKGRAELVEPKDSFDAAIRTQAKQNPKNPKNPKIR